MAIGYTDSEYAKRAAQMILQDELVSVQVALHQYLGQFTLDEIRLAHPSSTLKNVLRVWNRCRNLHHGSVADWNIERLPVTTKATVDAERERIKTERDRQLKFSLAASCVERQRDWKEIGNLNDLRLDEMAVQRFESEGGPAQ
jgi:hypothetical protein